LDQRKPVVLFWRQLSKFCIRFVSMYVTKFYVKLSLATKISTAERVVHIFPYNLYHLMYKFYIESLFSCGNVELRKHCEVTMHFSTRPRADNRLLYWLCGIAVNRIS